MRQLCVVGSGYVGLVTGTCFADMGNSVTLVDIDEGKIELLQAGGVPIYEPGLAEMVQRNTDAGRMRFTTCYRDGLENAEFVFVCVGTPSGVDGEADLQYVRAAAQTIAKTMRQPLIVINKSTVPVGTGDWTDEIISSNQHSRSTSPSCLARSSCARARQFPTSCSPTEPYWARPMLQQRRRWPSSTRRSRPL